MRRFGRPRKPEISYAERPGVYGIIASGEMLLLTQTDTLQLPGGGIDPGESPLRALHRECYEETGWKIAPVRRLGAYQRYAWLPEYGFYARKICQIYICRPVRRLGPATEPDHMPLWMSAANAVAHIDVSGDAVFVARAIREGWI
ncbi:NUDIX domain-containing protein [Paracoccaceae bacterium GXU_MW_L88]